MIVYSTVYSDADQRKHQSSASLAFVRGIHRGPVNSPHKWPVTRKMNVSIWWRHHKMCWLRLWLMEPIWSQGFVNHHDECIQFGRTPQQIPDVPWHPWHAQCFVVICFLVAIFRVLWIRVFSCGCIVALNHWKKFLFKYSSILGSS